MGTTSSQRSSLTSVQGQGPPRGSSSHAASPLISALITLGLDGFICFLSQTRSFPKGRGMASAPSVSPLWPGWGLNRHSWTTDYARGMSE